jgi:hypothetical protein
VRYLHFCGAPRNTLCAPWEEVTSLEALLERHLHEEERRAAQQALFAPRV